MEEVPLFFKIALCFGVDLGYTRTLDNKHKYLSKFLYVTIILLNIFILSVPAVTDHPSYDKLVMQHLRTAISTGSLWFGTMIVQYILYTIVLLRSKYSLCNFLFDLENYDSRVNQLKGSIVSKVMVVLVISVYITKVMFAAAGCFDPDLNYCEIFKSLRYFIYQIPSISIDIIVFELFIIYYYAYKYIGLVKCSLINDSDIDLKLLKKAYAGLATFLERIQPEYDMLLCIELITDLPKLVGMFWFSLVFMKERAIWVLHFGAYFYAFVIILQVFLPALTVSMVMSQVDDLKLSLHEQLLREQKENTEVLSVLRYMSARPLHHQLWQVFPTDLRLPMALFSLCVTYLIVLIQFSHLYD